MRLDRLKLRLVVAFQTRFGPRQSGHSHQIAFQLKLVASTAAMVAGFPGFPGLAGVRRICPLGRRGTPVRDQVTHEVARKENHGELHRR